MRKLLDYKPLSVDAETGLLAQCIPQGKAWDAKNDKDSNLHLLLKSLATEINTLQERIYTMVTQWDVTVTEDLILEWETAVGIPDECRAAADDISTRRTDIITKLRKIPIITVADYEELAETITGEAGWNIRPGSDDFPANAMYKFVLLVTSPSTASGAFTYPFSSGILPIASLTGGTGVTSALDLDGTDDYMDMGVIATPASFSISIWVRFASMDDYDRLIQKYSVIDGYAIRIHNDGGNFKVLWQSTRLSSSANTMHQTVLSINTWYHIVIVDNGSVRKLYVDAVLDTGDSHTASSSGSGSSVELGRRAGGVGVHLEGAFDQTIIYDTELSASDVTDLFNSGVGTTSPPLTGNIIARWEMDDDSATLSDVVDSSSGGLYDGTMYSGASTDLTSLHKATTGIVASGGSGTTATATVTDTSEMITGTEVDISGADQPEYNGTYTITVVNITTFTYEFSGSTTSPATGTILVNYGIDQDKINALAAETLPKYIAPADTILGGYPLAGTIRSDVLQCVFRKVTPANVVVVFD